MSYFAIAAFVHGKDTVGARVINTENNNIKDMKNSDLIHLISTGYKFENLDVKDGKIRWSQGTVDRYPQIYSTGNMEKTQSAIVLGEFSGETRKFKICNYEGKQVTLDEVQVIAHAKKFGLANCKVSHKDGTYFIQSISGELPKLKSGTSFKYRVDGTLVIELPEDGSVVDLQIPERAGTIPIGNLEFIEVIPKSMGANIKRLALPKDTMHIKPSYFTRFPNLELIYVQNDRSILYEYAFAGLTKLKKIILNGCAYIYPHACEGCISLESFISKTPIDETRGYAFKGCKALNIQEFLNNKVIRVIGKDTFKGASATELIMPMGVSYFDLKIFVGVKGLNKLTINDPNTVARFLDRFNLKGTLDVYVKERSSMVSNHTVHDGFEVDLEGGKVVFHTIGFKDESADTQKAIAKTGLLMRGKDTSKLKFSKTEDCAIVIGSAPAEEVKKFIINVCNRHIREWGYSSALTESLGEFQLEVYVYHYRDKAQIRKMNQVDTFDEAIVYSNKKQSVVVPLNKQFILDYLTKPMDVQYHSPGNFWLPTFIIPNHGKIDKIEYRDGELFVTFRNKVVERVHPHDRG